MADNAYKIGSKLQDLRQRRGFTREDVAAFARVDKRYIAAIESDIVSPSLEWLSKVLLFLGTDIHEFMKPDPEYKFSFTPDEITFSPQQYGEVASIIPETASSAFSLVRCLLTPHVPTPWQDGSSWGYVVRGRLDIETMDGYVERILADSAFVLPQDTTYRLVNPVEFPCEILLSQVTT